jgi:hypothetical protein
VGAAPSEHAVTIDPTALQTARLSIGQIRVCWPMLAEARTARVSRGSVALSGRAAASRDEDLRAERADRDGTVAYRALATTPAPTNLAVLDAEVEVHATIGATTWAIRSDLRQWSRLVPAIPAGVDGKLSWLTGMLEGTGPDVVDQAAKDLARSARMLASAVGIRLDDDETWHSLGRRCPSCGLRALWIWQESPDPREWTVECRGEIEDEDCGRTHPCRCAGPDCDCQRPGARPKTRHLWPA